MKTAISIVTLAASLVLPSCGSDAEQGTLEVAIYGEEFIEEGIPSDAFIDGWSVSFDLFEVTVGDVSAASNNAAPALTLTENNTYDLTQATSGQGQLILSGDVDGGLYDSIGYRVGSIHVEGSAKKGAITKTFAWTLDTPTRYSGCEGTATIDGETARTQLTIHADHLFYDDLVSSAPNVAFDLIAQADDGGDADGKITATELAAIDITGEEKYQVGNATEVTDLWTFIDYQSSTVGHIDGEGHCGTAKRE